MVDPANDGLAPVLCQFFNMLVIQSMNGHPVVFEQIAREFLGSLLLVWARPERQPF